MRVRVAGAFLTGVIFCGMMIIASGADAKLPPPGPVLDPPCRESYCSITMDPSAKPGVLRPVP